MPKPKYYGYRHERKAMSDIARRVEDRLTETSDPEAETPHRSSKKIKKTFRVEYRIRPELHERYQNFRWFANVLDWNPYYYKYATERSRAQGIKRLNQKDNLYEYRIPEETS